MHSFESIIFRETYRYVVEIPENIVRLLGNSRYIFIKGYADEVFFRSTIVPRKEKRYVLYVNAEIRAKIKKGDGDTVFFKLEHDSESRDLPTPEDLEMVLSEEPGLLEEFYRLSSSHRRDLIKYMELAKQASTRLKRVEFIAQRIRERLRDKHRKKDMM